MKKLILLAFCGFLMLLLSIESAGTARYESASGPSAQYADDPTHTTQTNTPNTPHPSEAVSDIPVSFEIVFSTPAPLETGPDTPAPSEAVSNDGNLTLIYQNPELPNGCEITSLAMLLAWVDCPVDKVELSDNYLPKQELSMWDGVRYGADPNRAFVGNPSSPNGWYCFEGPILEAGNAWLSDRNSQFQAVSLSGLTQEELERCLDDGIPLTVWVTLGYAAPRNPASFSWYLPDGSHYIPYANLHCVVLAGWDGDHYQIADPIYGWQTVSPGAFWSSFSAMGCRAVAVLPA